MREVGGGPRSADSYAGCDQVSELGADIGKIVAFLGRVDGAGPNQPVKCGLDRSQERGDQSVGRDTRVGLLADGEERSAARVPDHGRCERLRRRGAGGGQGRHEVDA